MSLVAGGSKALLQFLYRAPIGLMQATRDGRLEMVNPWSAQLLMPLARGAALDNLFDVLRPVAPQLRAMVDGFRADSGLVCEALRLPVDGFHPQGPRTYALSILKMDESRLMAVLIDATSEAKREETILFERLHQAARVDVLTRMPNRVAIAESMEAALTRTQILAGRVAILLVGCERLAEIGESFGDVVRNRVLEMMAQRLSAVIEPEDRDEDEDCGFEAVVAKISGDEFVVLLQQLETPEHANSLADRLIETLRKPYPVGSQHLHCAVSIGVVHGDDGIGPDDAIRDAGIAMREAKRGGGSRWIEFDVAMRERAVLRGSLEMELRNALAEQQLFVVYQPIVHLQEERMPSKAVGVEALVRWGHPIRGVVAPIDFIGIAEQSGVIGDLGEFVLATACRQFAEWSRTFGRTAPRTLAVNLSRGQLGDPALVDRVEAALARAGLSAERLQLEITESLAAQDDAVQDQLHKLKSLGVKLALDDFGTGYSSLSSLHLLPVDTVKIDRSFVTLAESSPHHRVLIEATIRVATSLGMTTVAEGLETDGQIAIVKSLGCDKGQGYRFARPLGADELARWLNTP